MVSGDGRALVLKSAIRNKSEIFRIERRPTSGALNAAPQVSEFALTGVVTCPPSPAVARRWFLPHYCPRGTNRVANLQSRSENVTYRFSRLEQNAAIFLRFQ
ncbi:hypothetical protein FF011L_43430 [Roseimaritima multifibrata]|uniref:Uncharacterized protein n=1 Tax=Roseimaritima multifibrata TaxID=1930274 RepID=A0A517MKX3_9BACT|nr:hypothetical protein FF011L_43430 [Roseimaritima multifibrata]